MRVETQRLYPERITVCDSFGTAGAREIWDELFSFNALGDRALPFAARIKFGRSLKTMRRRLLFGLAPIFVLIVAMGAYAVLLFAKLGSQVDVILRENFRSVLAGQQMKEAAERIDSGLFFSLVGEEKRGQDLSAQNLQVFREALKTEL
ncbi:MAG TPA: hypothetical protein VIS99_05845, partial [Terrimicrobiaceae bacterium]